MPAREDLFEAYALPARTRTRVRLNFVESADGAATLDGEAARSGARATASSCRCCVPWPTSSSSVRARSAPRAMERDVGEPSSAPGGRAGLSPQPAFAVVSGALDLEPEDPVFAAPQHPVVVTTTHARVSRARR